MQHYETMLLNVNESSSQSVRSLESRLQDALQDIKHKAMQAQVSGLLVGKHGFLAFL